MSDLEKLKDSARHILLDLRQMKSFCENPLIIAEAKGIVLTDVRGKRYFDGISGIYVVNIGHGNQRVLEAIRRQHERVSFVAPLHGVSDVTLRYAARLAEITPDGLNTMKLLSGGSEATETAMKFSRQYHRQRGNSSKYKFIGLYKGFHGGTMGALSATGLGGPRKSVFGPFLEGSLHVPAPLCFRCPYGLKHPSCQCLCARMVEQMIVSEGPESVAAFIVEPIGNTGGIVTPPPEYLPAIRDICTRHNVLLIFDEIITGFGRTGNWFAAQTFNTTPDLLCMGKGMSSGYAPLAGVAIRDELYFSTFWGDDDANIHFAHGHTYGGNPIAAAAGLAALEVIEEGGLIANGQNTGDHIRRRLEREVAELGILGQVRGKGCLVCVEFVEDPARMRPFAAERQFGKRIERRLLNKGLILRCDPHWIAFAPPLITTLAQADEMVDIFVDCVKEELNNGG
jgi:adenosylmethionine-8-amino-7-oxononanoate aminotransferase